jgi:hypothetical protein
MYTRPREEEHQQHWRGGEGGDPSSYHPVVGICDGCVSSNGGHVVSVPIMQWWAYVVAV